MNVSAGGSRHIQGTNSGKGAVAAGGRRAGKATGAELPDFAAFLGMALSPGDLEQQLGKGAAVKAMAACGPVAASSDSTEAGETEDGDANGTVAATLALNAQGLPIKPQAAPAADKATSAHTPKMAAMPVMMGEAAKAQDGALAAGAEAGQSTREWNVQDLAHQLRAAIGQVATGSEQQEKTAITPGHGALAATHGKGQGEKIHADGTPTPVRGAATGKGQGAGQSQTQQPGVTLGPLAWSAGDKNAGQPFHSADPRFKAQAATDAAAGVTEKKMAALEHETNEEMASAAASPAPLTWSPTPAAGASHDGTRMPGLIEQVRQVADFLAERTEGVIRMGEQGVEANLKLYPPDLGGVRVQLTVNSDRTTQAQFIVERPETAQLLQQHLRSFQQGLESHGLTVDRVQVTVQGTVRLASPAGGESGWRQNGSQDFRRENAQTSQREGQQPRRNGRGGTQEFEG